MALIKEYWILERDTSANVFQPPSKAIEMANQVADLRLNEIAKKLGISRESFPESPVRYTDLSNPKFLEAAAQTALNFVDKSSVKESAFSFSSSS